MAIMDMSLQENVHIAIKPNPFQILDIGIWEMVKLEINHGAKNVAVRMENESM